MFLKNIIKRKLANYIYSNEIIPHLSERLQPYLNDSLIINNKAIFENINYINTHSQNNRKVIYTCLTGNYDSLPLHLYLRKDFDYICFTDNKKLLSMNTYGAWTIQPLKFSELDNTRNNRWHKFHPHILFPDYDESIYIDSNMQIIDDFIFNQIENKKSTLVIPKHFARDCVYEEVEAVLDQVVASGRESKENVMNILNFLKTQNMPCHFGQTENNMIYRKHNDPDIINMMEEWWNLIDKYSKRDQLSSSYVFWKNGINLENIYIPNLRKDGHVNFLQHH